MLLIRRRTNESLRIGQATVKILRIRGGLVTLGIDAPPEIQIVRDDARDTTPKHRPPSAPAGEAQ
jgi:carbon storage regulator CsrA